MISLVTAVVSAPARCDASAPARPGSLHYLTPAASAENCHQQPRSRTSVLRLLAAHFRPHFIATSADDEARTEKSGCEQRPTLVVLDNPALRSEPTSSGPIAARRTGNGRSSCPWDHRLRLSL